MKNRHYLTTSLLMVMLLGSAFVLKGQTTESNPVFISGDAAVDSLFEASLQEIVWNPNALTRTLPSSVDNSNLNEGYMPPIFDQGLSSACVQCAEIGYVFTYEINRYKGVAAGSHWINGTETQMQNLYHPFFTYNFLNCGNGDSITNYGSGFNIVAENGCPTLVDYYSPVLNSTYNPHVDQLPFRYWMSGAGKYVSATENTISFTENVVPYKITWGNTYGSLDDLKTWLYTHNTRDGVGGLAIISVYMANETNNHYTLGTISSGNPHQGEVIISSWSSSIIKKGGHALTIVGYDDNIWVSNNHVQPTSNTPLANCEKGAFKVANSWGTDWGTQGYVWVPYKLLANGLQYNKRAYTCVATGPKEKTVFLCATIAHPNRRYMRIRLGKGLTTASTTPDSTASFNIFHYQGDTLNGVMIPMNGNVNNPGPIDLALNFGEHLDLDTCLRYFFQVIDSTQGGSYSNNEAYIKDYRLKDYRWNEEFVLDCPNTMMPILKGGTTTLAIDYHLLPFGSPITSNFTMGTDRVARRTVAVNGGTFTIGSGVSLDMYGTDDYDCQLTIGPNASLVIGSNAVITAKRGTCKIQVNGNLQIGQSVRFEAKDGATLEIVVNNNSALTVTKATFVNCTLSLPQNNVTFNSCEFQGTPLAMDLGVSGGGTPKAATVSDCVFIPNGKTIANAVYIKSYPQYLVGGCSIVPDTLGGAFTNGIYIHNCGGGSDTTNKKIGGNEISGCSGSGIQMYASSGSINQNHIHDNAFGVKLLNNSNIRLFLGDCSATLATKTQYLHDNTYNEVYMTGGCVPQYFRYNSISDDDNVPFVYHDETIGFGHNGLNPREPIDLRYNHWGPSGNDTTHVYTNHPGGYYCSPLWVLGNCNAKATDAGRLIASADSLAGIGEYPAAKALYIRVVEDYPSTVSAETALKSLLGIERYAGNDYAGLKHYYQTEDAILDDGTLSHMAFSLANKCDEIMGNYEAAVAWYENVLADPETSFNDSIFAAIDLGDLYLVMEGNGAKGIAGKMTQYVPKSTEAHLRQTHYALSLLPKRVESVTSEQEFKEVYKQPEGVILYPNPSLSWVGIDYKLPNGCTQATLDLFNTFGMKVMTVPLEGESGSKFVMLGEIPSGVYSYSVRCGNEVLDGKLVIVR
jgi:hypothetical protein